MKELQYNGQRWIAESAPSGDSSDDHDNMRVRFFCGETGQEAFTRIPFRIGTFDTVPVSTLVTALVEALASLPHRQD